MHVLRRQLYRNRNVISSADYCQMVSTLRNGKVKTATRDLKGEKKKLMITGIIQQKMIGVNENVH